MIELNCSYEESKKILELGYDFSKVCATFSASGKTSSHGLPFATMITNPFLTAVGHLENLKHLKSLPYLLLGKEINIDSITPIIPKAALEACLPDYLLEKGCNRHFSLFYHVRKFMGEFYWANCRDESLTDNWFNSAFEAFTWCHENYPEELKAKFEEVMA